MWGRLQRGNAFCRLTLGGGKTNAPLSRKASVGGSFASYQWLQRQWALPIDAATQVQAWRPDLIEAPPRMFDEVLRLARKGQVLCPLRPPHALLSFCSLAANLGAPCNGLGSEDFVDPLTGEAVFGLLRALADQVDPACFNMDPIAVFERMAARDSEISVAPLAYGYVSYAKPGFRDVALAFADLPQVGSLGPVGSALGGTGIAVSARTRHKEEAIAFAYWVVSAEVQRGPYVMAGGQPGHAAAWDDPVVNASAGNFYLTTRATLEGAWIRPRHDGYMQFQDEAARRINAALMASEKGEQLIADLNRTFRESFL